jgi:hypothetical protein
LLLIINLFRRTVTFGILLGGQAKSFTESRLLHRKVKVTLLSLPQSTATPFQAGSTSAPPPATIFIGNGMYGILQRSGENRCSPGLDSLQSSIL